LPGWAIGIENMNIKIMILVAMMVTMIATVTRTKYVKIDTNIEHYNAKDIVYHAVADVIMSFQKLQLRGLEKHPDIVFKPMMKKTDADAIGATYIIDEDDYKDRTIKNPYKGEEFYELKGFDEDGNFIFSEPKVYDGADYVTQPAALDEDWVFLEFAPTLNTLIEEYIDLMNAEGDNAELDDWFGKANKVVPLLWD
jgi:hypothetical protein